MTRIAFLIVLSCVWTLCIGCGQPNASRPPGGDTSQDEGSLRTEAAHDEIESESNAAEQTDADDSSEQEPHAASEPEEKAQSVDSPDQLVAALKEKNPGFSGQIQMQPISAELLAVGINDPKVTDISPLARQRIGVLDLSNCDLEDLSPLEGMPLIELYLENNRRLSDISALRGMPLRKLYLSNTRIENLGPLRGAPLMELNALGAQVNDLSPLAGSPLQMLWLTDCPVRDIAPLAKTPLVSLTVENTDVDDISPLAGHPIQRLHIGGAKVTDLTPVGKMQLTRLIFTPSKVKKGIDVVRPLPIRELGTNFDNRMPPTVFWEKYDKGELD